MQNGKYDTVKIGLLAGTSLSDFRIRTIEPIFTSKQFIIKLAIIDKRPKLSIKKKLIKNIKRGRGGYIFIMAIKRIFTKKETNIPTIQYCNEKQIEYIETNKPYSEAILSYIKSYDLDILLLVGGFGIVKKQLLDITPKGVLSYHHGEMKKYRGMPVGFWELYNNEKEMGMTVQVLSQGIDTGYLIEEKKISISINDNLNSLVNRAMYESTDMLYSALKKIFLQNIEYKKLDKYGKIYTLPNLKQWLFLQIKLLLRKFFKNNKCILKDNKKKK